MPRQQPTLAGSSQFAPGCNRGRTSKVGTQQQSTFPHTGRLLGFWLCCKPGPQRARADNDMNKLEYSLCQLHSLHLQVGFNPSLVRVEGWQLGLDRLGCCSGCCCCRWCLCSLACSLVGVSRLVGCTVASIRCLQGDRQTQGTDPKSLGFVHVTDMPVAGHRP